MGTVFLWIIGIILGLMLGGFGLSFFISTPIRFVNFFKTNINSYRKKRISDKCYHYARTYNIDIIESKKILAEFNIRFNRLSTLSTKQWLVFYNYLYKTYDPQYREDTIDEVLKGD